MKLTEVANLSRVLPHKLETYFRVAGSAERATNMSQSNNSPAPCADKGGHHKATTSVCDTLRSEARGQRKRNPMSSSDREKRRNSWGCGE